MKIAPAKTEAFLNRPPASVRSVLLFGPDKGLVQERAKTLARGVVADLQDPFAVARFDAKSVKDDPSKLHDEMAALSLMGGRRLVWVQDAGDSLVGALKNLFEDLPATDTFLLIEGGELEARSKLRGFYDESDDRLASIACYVEEGAALMRSITSILGAEGIDVPRDVARAMADLLPPDQMAMRAELEKLALYIGADEKTRAEHRLTIEDVDAILANTGEARMDDLMMAVAGGQSEKAAGLLDHLWAEQMSPVAILRAAQRHFTRLHLARAHMDQGMSPDGALKKLQPPIFWKYQDAMKSQVQRWSAPRLDRMLQLLLETEAAVKRTGAPAEAMCGQLMMLASKG